MKRLMTATALSLVLAISLCLCLGCSHSTASTSPQVVFAATILSASDATDTFSVALRAANDGVVKLQATEPGYYASVHPYLVNLARLNDKAVATIAAAQAGDTTADWKGALLAISTAAAQTDPTVFGFKNPNTQAEVKIIFASFNAAVQAITASFGGK
jgi:hypothetical protein